MECRAGECRYQRTTLSICLSTWDFLARAGDRGGGGTISRLRTAGRAPGNGGPLAVRHGRYRISGSHRSGRVDPRERRQRRRRRGGGGTRARGRRLRRLRHRRDDLHGDPPRRWTHGRDRRYGTSSRFTQPREASRRGNGRPGLRLRQGRRADDAWPFSTSRSAPTGRCPCPRRCSRPSRSPSPDTASARSRPPGPAATTRTSSLAPTICRSWSWKTGRPSGEPGALVCNHDLAGTFRELARDGVDSFYRGAIADRIEADMVKNGG